MKIYLDDERQAPEGWTQCRWPEEVIRLLQSDLNHLQVTHLSLDHDLGDDVRTGYDVILWIEEVVSMRWFYPPEIKVHSANGPARLRMEAGIRSIANHYEQWKIKKACYHDRKWRYANRI